MYEDMLLQLFSLLHKFQYHVMEQCYKFSPKLTMSHLLCLLCMGETNFRMSTPLQLLHMHALSKILIQLHQVFVFTLSLHLQADKGCHG